MHYIYCYVVEDDEKVGGPKWYGWIKNKIDKLSENDL